MSSYLLGHLHGQRKPFSISRTSFDTHWHLIGGTGKGKTTAIHTMLHELLLDPTHDPCVIIVDRLGGLSFDLLRWMTSDFCTQDVRDRLVYIEPARDGAVLGFNPLVHDSEGHAYYKVSRATEIILRGWASQNLSEMPRLARWLFNSFLACALLKLTIADSVHLLLPGSSYHRPLLEALPPRLQAEWKELLHSHSGEVQRMLESARNRLKPFHEFPALRYMFGTTDNQLDIRRFMRQGKIVLLNLSPGNRIPDQIADAIGGLVLNEVLTTARSLQPIDRTPTYVFLDEFQRFVGPDIETAIPEVRQLGIKLILSHQSLSQLVRGDIDLTNLIFQCQSRMIFGVQGEDADILAHELASLEFNPYHIKQELFTRHQRIAGHRITELGSYSDASSQAENWMEQYGSGWSRYDGQSQREVDYRARDKTRSEGSGRSGTESNGQGGSRSRTSSVGRHEQLVPIHEDYLELASRTFMTFDEDRHVWARDIRRAKRGEAFIRLVDAPDVLHIDVKRSAPGYLSWEPSELAREMPEVLDDVERLIARNFQADHFSSPAEIDVQIEKRLTRVLAGREALPPFIAAGPSDGTGVKDPFL